MKKILFVANVAKEHILKFHIPTIKKFKAEGWIVDVACSGNEEIPYCDKQYHASWKRSPFTIKTLKGIRELKEIIDEQNYDVVYCHTPVGGLIGRVAARKARKEGTKVIYFAHGLHFFKGSPLINWLIYYPIEKWLAHITDTIFLINKEDFDNVQKFFPSKIKSKIFPGIGVDFSRLEGQFTENDKQKYRQQLNIPKDATVLIYVAELIKNKNQGMLIKALKKVREENPNTYLLLVGPDHYNGKYQKLAEKEKVSAYVRFTGWKNDIGNLLKSSDICVASSIREGFGLNLVEAMYCGLPVVATRNRGHSSIINDGENGFLVEIGDFEKMAERINALINDEVDKDKFSNLSLEAYDVKRVSDTLFDVISKEN